MLVGAVAQDTLLDVHAQGGAANIARDLGHDVVEAVLEGRKHGGVPKGRSKGAEGRAMFCVFFRPRLGPKKVPSLTCTGG